MKQIIIGYLLLAATIAYADEQRIYETDKFGNRLHQAYEVDGDRIYETDKYGNRQSQGYEIDGDRIYETDNYGNRKTQGYEIEGDRMYEVDNFGNRQSQGYEVERNPRPQTGRSRNFFGQPTEPEGRNARGADAGVKDE